MSLQFCANLDFLFKEVSFLDRYDSAAKAGLLPWLLLIYIYIYIYMCVCIVNYYGNHCYRIFRG